MTITFEAILEAPIGITDPEMVAVDTAVYVKKYIDQFLYTNTIHSASIPIAYLGNESYKSTKNLIVVDKSHSVSLNNSSLVNKATSSFVGKSYTSSYSVNLFTNKTYINSKGIVAPLFYRHDLPPNTNNVTISIKSYGNIKEKQEGYIVDYAEGAIYTNYINVYDVNTEAYLLYYVSGSTSDGTVFDTLLNSIPVAKEATWEDIEADGSITTDYPVYAIAKSGSGYTYTFNSATRWYYKPIDTGLLIPKRPLSISSDSPWYMRFTNGDISGNINGDLHRYWVPEYQTQAFDPYKPYVFGVHEEVFYVNSRVLKTVHDKLFIDVENGFHLEIWVSDENDIPIKVFTTNSSLDGTIVSGYNIYYEYGPIASWDNANGFISMALDIFPKWKYFGKFYYQTNEYEYKELDVNPLTTSRMRDHLYVFYCVPDAHAQDRAIHYLIVDPGGTIIYTSQGSGYIDVPNLSLYMADDTYNTDTIIGMKYFSTGDNFLTLYSSGYDNEYSYLILAEVSSVDVSIEDDMVVIDVTRPGGSIVEQYREEAFRANPRLLQSMYGYGPNGQVVPQTNVMVLEPPVTLLEGYGGVLTREQAEKELRTMMPAHGYAMVKWDNITPNPYGYSTDVGEITITIPWEVPGTYNLYRKILDTDTWTLVHTVTQTASTNDISYVDTGLVSDTTYRYLVTLSNGAQYPDSDVLLVEAL